VCNEAASRDFGDWIHFRDIGTQAEVKAKIDYTLQYLYSKGRLFEATKSPSSEAKYQQIE
jgi:hypothetical protein